MYLLTTVLSCVGPMFTTALNGPDHPLYTVITGLNTLLNSCSNYLNSSFIWGGNICCGSRYAGCVICALLLMCYTCVTHKSSILFTFGCKQWVCLAQVSIFVNQNWHMCDLICKPFLLRTMDLNAVAGSIATMFQCHGEWKVQYNHLARLWCYAAEPWGHVLVVHYAGCSRFCFHTHICYHLLESPVLQVLWLYHYTPWKGCQLGFQHQGFQSLDPQIGEVYCHKLVLLSPLRQLLVVMSHQPDLHSESFYEVLFRVLLLCSDGSYCVWCHWQWLFWRYADDKHI